MAYTYDDFLKAAQSGGDSLTRWSSEDIETAKKYPEFGIALVGLHKDYNAATTQEAKVIAQEAAAQLRNSYAGSSAVGGTTAAANKEATLQTTGELQTGATGFTYDRDNDPVWQSLKKNYLTEGERATQNTLAQTAAATGGVPSSYAVGAATQAGDYYAEKLNSLIPQLQENAYSKYAEEKSDAYSLASGMLSSGIMPSKELLTASGISTEDAGKIMASIVGAADGETGGRTSGGGGYDNGSLSTEQVIALQQALGVTADGLYGPQTQAAAGGLSADEAYQMAMTAYDNTVGWKQAVQPVTTSNPVTENDLSKFGQTIYKLVLEAPDPFMVIFKAYENSPMSNAEKERDLLILQQLLGG